MNRAERRRIGRSENEWRQELSPKERNMGSGWFGEFSKVMTNGKYVVMIRTIKTDWGYVKHACMRNATGTDIPWREKQRIKNELFGVERHAVEVFPRESELVDHAPMYHLWILPDNMHLPFGID
ncbi:DUF7694 domain-containing protein [Lysinibacillus fusiformis]|uniref:DUF7694 domain-containing protein n=1 Tax=Lysinibacillus fusiformis TaxID=28031 RepID=UPI003CFBEBD9